MLAREEIEARAEQVLGKLAEWVWDGETLPVPMDDIASDHYRLLIREADDLSSLPGVPEVGGGETLSGLLLPGPGEIWVNRVEAGFWPGRRRFTIGHELGHWELHLDGQRKLFCRRPSIDSGGPPPEGTPIEAPAPEAARELDPIEEEASIFSAALLMPSFLIEREWETSGEQIGVMQERFDTSRKAMVRRLRDVLGVEVGEDAPA